MFVYVLKNDEGFYKIGYSKNVKKRIKELETANSGNLYLIKEFKTKYAAKIEARLHSYFKFQQINREWFDLSIEDLNKILELCESYHNSLKLITT